MDSGTCITHFTSFHTPPLPPFLALLCFCKDPFLSSKPCLQADPHGAYTWKVWSCVHRLWSQPRVRHSQWPSSCCPPRSRPLSIVGASWRESRRLQASYLHLFLWALAGNPFPGESSPANILNSALLALGTGMLSCAVLPDTSSDPPHYPHYLCHAEMLPGSCPHS